MAFAASGLTLFSGFGLGTLLMPVVAIFFPLDVAVAITAVVHFSNNLFKVALIGRAADTAVLWRFGLPAVLAAFMGALLLASLANLPTLFDYSAFGAVYQVTTLKFVIGLLMLLFLILENWPLISRMSIEPKFLPLGGIISGFFGGLSGHQGAFRSMFLIKAGLDKQAFVATGVMLAVLVDMARISVYGWHFSIQSNQLDWPLIGAATLAAFAGAYLGKHWLQKITIVAVKRVVSGMLMVISLGLISGLL